MHILPITGSYDHHDEGHHEYTSFTSEGIKGKLHKFLVPGGNTGKVEDCSKCAIEKINSLTEKQLIDGCKDSFVLDNCVKDLVRKRLFDCYAKCASFTESSVVLIAVGGMDRGRGSNFL